MHSRCLVLGAAGWAAGYTGIYIVIVGGQGNSPAWWYVTLLATGTGVLALAVTGRPRPLLILGAFCLTLAALAGLLSIGLLLVPAVVAATVAASRPSWRPHTGDSAS